MPRVIKNLDLQEKNEQIFLKNYCLIIALFNS